MMQIKQSADLPLKNCDDDLDLMKILGLYMQV